MITASSNKELERTRSTHFAVSPRRSTSVLRTWGREGAQTECTRTPLK